MQLSFLDALLETTKQQEDFKHDQFEAGSNQESKVRPSKRVKSNSGAGLEVVLEDETTRLANSLWKKVCNRNSQTSCNLTAESGDSVIPFSPLDFDFKFPAMLNDGIKTETIVQPTSMNLSQKKVIEFFHNISYKEDSLKPSSIDSLLANHQLRHLMGLGTQTQKDTFQCFLDQSKDNVEVEVKKRKALPDFSEQSLLTTQEPTSKRKLIEIDPTSYNDSFSCNKQLKSTTATTRSSENCFREEQINNETSSFAEKTASSLSKKSMSLDPSPIISKNFVFESKIDQMLPPTQNNKKKSDKELQLTVLESTQEQIYDSPETLENKFTQQQQNKFAYLVDSKCNDYQEKKKLNSQTPNGPTNSRFYYLPPKKFSNVSTSESLKSMQFCMTTDSWRNKLNKVDNLEFTKYCEETNQDSAKHSRKHQHSETRYLRSQYSDLRQSEKFKYFSSRNSELSSSEKNGPTSKLLSCRSDKLRQCYETPPLLNNVSHHCSAKNKENNDINKLQKMKKTIFPPSSPNYPTNQENLNSPEVIPYFSYKQNHELLKEFQSLMHKELASPTWSNNWSKHNRTLSSKLNEDHSKQQQQRKKLPDTCEHQQHLYAENSAVNSTSTPQYKTPKKYTKETFATTAQESSMFLNHSKINRLSKTSEKTSQRKTTGMLTENKIISSASNLSDSLKPSLPQSSSFHVIQLSTARRKLPPLVVKAGINTKSNDFALKTNSKLSQQPSITNCTPPIFKRLDSPSTKSTFSKNIMSSIAKRK